MKARYNDNYELEIPRSGNAPMLLLEFLADHFKNEDRTPSIEVTQQENTFTIYFEYGINDDEIEKLIEYINENL
jgi:hypothetical protein